MDARVGIGYDIHRLVKGCKLVLGGVEIPFEKGLDGHSDADCLVHAICDALLGALGRGDIGEHFPNTDPRYKGASSLVLLKDVLALVKKDSYRVSNLDCVILAEQPNLKAFKPAMKEAIAKVLDLKMDAVNIKATTTERLGAVGRGEGIASYATVLLVREKL